MRKPFLATVMCGVSLLSAAGSARAVDGGPYDFSFTAPGGTVRDEGIGVFPLMMSPSVTFIASLELEINDLSHDSASDLDIYLISPFGRFIEIMSDRGGMNSLDRVDLVFADKGTGLPGTPILSNTSANPYAPEGRFSGIDDGFETYVSKNGGPGSWMLLLVDDAPADTGSVGSFTLRGTVPEPMTLSLLGVGAVFAMRRRFSR